MIEFKDVGKVFSSKNNEIVALEGINLTINRGEIFGAIGYSGAGKSTLLRLINRLDTPTSGKVIVDGIDYDDINNQEIRNLKKQIGVVFQHFNLLSSKTVADNVGLPLVLAGVEKDKIKARVKELLEFVGLGDKLTSYPSELSGGQKQRVGIARALATNPKVLLCDEATSALDPQTTKQILELLKKINQQYQITIFIITHEMGVIRSICDKVAILEEGKVVESGTVFDVFTNPQTATGKEFVASDSSLNLPDYIETIISKCEEHTVYRIYFIGNSATTPLLSTAIKNYNVDANVLYGDITEIQSTPYGNLIVQFSGSKEEIKQATDFISNNGASLEEVK